jgi:hypothetical protein
MAVNVELAPEPMVMDIEYGGRTRNSNFYASLGSTVGTYWRTAIVATDERLGALGTDGSRQ